MSKTIGGVAEVDALTPRRNGRVSRSGSSSAEATTAAGLDTALFLDGALAEEPTTEDCTLTCLVGQTVESNDAGGGPPSGKDG